MKLKRLLIELDGKILRYLNFQFNYWSLLITSTSVILVWPILSLIWLSMGNSNGLWSHLFDTVIVKYALNTFLLMIGVALLALTFGVTTAWLVTNYEFKFKTLFDLLLLLPAACPAYLVAYAYTDFFDFAGPVQVYLRQLMGWQYASDYYFPEIRSLGGAIFVLASVLYPYIYLLCRTAFRQTPSSLAEVTIIYGRSKFWNVSLPLARPAIIAGLALVSMEVVSDFGTVEFFSLETLTLGIFNVWIGMNNITAAAQISIFTFLFIIVLLILEIKSRAQKRFNDPTSRQRACNPTDLNGAKIILPILVCSVPVMLGFFIPIGILISNILNSSSLTDIRNLAPILTNTLLISLSGAFLIVLIATFLASATHVGGNKFLQFISNISATGYAFPGTMLAIGVLVSIGSIDSFLDNLYKLNNWPFGSFYFSGTFAVLLFAYLVRFLAVSYGSAMSGLSKTSPALTSASRTLGAPFAKTIFKITIPLIKKSILAGGLLAFVDIMKELPMTLLLRPFNFETLATFTYQYAHDELMGQASLPAIVIIVFGLAPVVYLNTVLRER